MIGMAEWSEKSTIILGFIYIPYVWDSLLSPKYHHWWRTLDSQPCHLFPWQRQPYCRLPWKCPRKNLIFRWMSHGRRTADPNDWDFDPFTLSVDGDKLLGRGTADCWGHVALVAELTRKLGETKPKLKSTILAVFIANEENSAISGVGVDALVKDGWLNKLMEGPLFWIDTADKGFGRNGVFYLIFSSLFCSVKDVMKKLQEYVDDISENIQKLETRGPVSKYVLPDDKKFDFSYA